MKNILLLAISSAMLFTSCRYSECTNPSVALEYVVDSSGALVFKFDTYEKGSKFSKLISSEQDSAYKDTAYHYAPYRVSHTYVDDKFDYIITMAATGRTYKISDINYSGHKRVKADGIISENRTACTRTVNYTVNGQAFSTEGSTYEIGYGSAKGAVITITQ